MSSPRAFLLCSTWSSWDIERGCIGSIALSEPEPSVHVLVPLDTFSQAFSVPPPTICPYFRLIYCNTRIVLFRPPTSVTNFAKGSAMTLMSSHPTVFSERPRLSVTASPRTRRTLIPDCEAPCASTLYLCSHPILSCLLLAIS